MSKQDCISAEAAVSQWTSMEKPEKTLVQVYIGPNVYEYEATSFIARSAVG